MSNKNLLKFAAVVIAIVISYSLAAIVDNEFWVAVFMVMVLNILLTSSLRTVFILDEVSLGQVGFSLIGAYTSALLTINLGVSFWVGLLSAGCLSALIGFVLGYPFLKVKMLYFSILTLMASEIFRLTTYNWASFTGGHLGLFNIPPPAPITLPFIGTISFKSTTNYYYLALTIVIICLAILYGLEQSHLSRKWRAIRDADSLALSVGINVQRYKVINFTIACFFAGIAGALFAHYQGSLSAEDTGRFSFSLTLYLVILLVVGGKGKFSGPIIGVIFMEIFSEFCRPLGEYRNMAIGALAITVALLIPEGIVGIPSRLQRWLTGKGFTENKRGITAD